MSASNRARPHPWQIKTAEALRGLLRDSEIRLSHLVGDSAGAGCLQLALHPAGSRSGFRGSRTCARDV